MRTLIVGGSGKIGKLLNYKHSIKTFYKNRIKNGIKFNIIHDDFQNLLNKYFIDRVVLLSAISDPDVCFKKKKYSHKINVDCTKKLIDILIEKKIYFIFFSSEYIYDGKKGNFSEKSKIKPNNLYGKQKFAVEKYIKKNAENFSIFRIGKTYGDRINDKTLISNYLEQLIKKIFYFNVASDQVFNPLYVKDLKKIVNFFLTKKIHGIYNVGGPQQLSRYKILQIISKNLGRSIALKVQLNKISLKKFITSENRPFNVSMNINKLKKQIKFKMKTISNVSLEMIRKNNVKNKILKRG
tara:strand:- start:1013 stop:1900 length:888 start_codon:yes stop_codon:yes gene_type:complete